MMRKLLIFLVGIFFSLSSFAREITTELPYFNKVRTSHHINVVLTKGKKEHVRLVYDGVTADQIHFRVKGYSLDIYLEGARVTDKTIKIYKNGQKQKASYYESAKVTAYITYKELSGLEIRGEQSAVCEDLIDVKEFSLRIYGENNVTITTLNAEKLKAKLYGENKLNIHEGDVKTQKYNLYGENHIKTENIVSGKIAVNSFGENKLNLQAKEKIRVFGLGELVVVHSGNSALRKLVIGESRIEREI